MRPALLALVLIGCANENALQHALPAVIAPGDDEVPAATAPAPQEDPELASLEGTVCAPDGRTSVAHATVTVHHFQDAVIETNGRGHFQLFDLPPGTWDVDIEKGSFSTTLEVELRAGEVARLSVDACAPLDQGSTEIAVVTGEYDDIGALVDQLHFDYDVVNGTNGAALTAFLTDPQRMARYDVIFFNCGMSEAWTNQRETVVRNLREYVRNGGSVYASDWAWWLVESGWPDQNDFHGPDSRMGDALVGARGQVAAEVLDPTMMEALGRDTANIRFDLDSWAAMDGAWNGAEILIRGDYDWYQGFGRRESRGPLATRLYDGDGEVLFTSFHNERQTTSDMLVLLQEIILSL